MGFFDKIKNIKSNAKNDDSQIDNKDVIPLSLIELQKKNKLDSQNHDSCDDDKNYILSTNFTDLTKLVNRENEILLVNDVILDSNNNEQAYYKEGIPLYNDDIVIDGMGHVIDARGNARIFKIIGQNIVIKNAIFKNGFNENGGAIYVEEGASCLFENCQFKHNVAELRGGAIICDGSINLKNCTVTKNTSNDEGGAIDIQLNGTLKLINTEISHNFSPYGGAIINFGQTIIEDSEITNNSSKVQAGAIYNEKNSSLEIKGTLISNNTSHSVGAIWNFGNLSIANVKIQNNNSQMGGGAVNNQVEGIIIAENCMISNNSSESGGGGFLNHGNITLEQVCIRGNSAKRGGGLNNQNMGTINIKDCIITNNESTDVGGGIYNKNSMIIAESDLNNNFSQKEGGAIYNLGNLKIEDSVFSRNNCQLDGSVMYNEHETIKLVNCTITDHDNDCNLISNDSTLTCIDSKFYENKSETILNNNENSIMDIINGKFENNNINLTTLANNGEFYLSNSVFKDNSSKNSYADIINENYLKLTAIKFKNDCITVLNEGEIEAKKLPKEKIEINFDNKGKIDMVDYISSQEDYGFDYLYDFIYNPEIESKKLEHNIRLKNHEVDFYEGGIEICYDDTVIDGNNRIIDANNKSRIFLITGKNITLKNFIFKNGNCKNNFDSHVTGGGAIQVIKDVSLNLENCKFINNSTTDDGGAIFNNGTLYSKGNEFKNNVSQLFGGAIYTRKSYKTENDLYEGNEAKIGGAIYNKCRLIVENVISVKNNKSSFKQPLYNAGHIELINVSDEHGEIIFNTDTINLIPKDSTKTYAYLQKSIENSNEIILNNDIHYDYKKDNELGYILTISNEELTIDGNGHTINGKNKAGLFNILNKNGKIHIKNLIFKNLYSNVHHILENHSNLTIENCTFLNCTPHGDTALINNHETVLIVNSNFYNNFSKRESLIKNNKGNINIFSSDFINNHAQKNGGVINNTQKDKITDSQNEIVIENSNFICNSAKNMGGVIFNSYGSVKISNSKLTQNTAFHDAGVIKNYGNLVIKNSELQKNSSKLSGGAIVNENEGTVMITDSLISHNNSNKSGAGFIINFGKTSIKQSKVNKNNSKKEGGAIINQGELVIEYSSFKQNKSDLHGGAIASNNLMVIKNSKFNENTALMDGGSIFSEKAAVHIMNSSFDQNISNEYGGAITNNQGVLEINDCTLKQNYANFGGAIASLGLINMANIIFSMNSAKTNGGGVWLYSKDFIASNNCQFTDNYPNDVYTDQ